MLGSFTFTTPTCRWWEDPDRFDFGFRMLKLHNPAMFNSGALARAKRDAKARRTGPYGLPPSPIQVPP